MELVRPPATRQLGRDLVDPLGDDEHRSVHRLRQEVAHRPVEAPRQHDALPVLRHERERAVDRQHRADVVREQSAPRLVGVDRPEPLGLVGDQVDDAGDVVRCAHAGEYLALVRMLRFGGSEQPSSARHSSGVTRRTALVCPSDSLR